MQIKVHGMRSLFLLQKSFLAFLVAMGIIVTLGDAHCWGKIHKPGEAKDGKNKEDPLT